MTERTEFTHELGSSTEGALREALATLGNFEQLLGSRNVAPKAIMGVLPDVRLCCEPLLSNLDELRRRSAPPGDEDQYPSAALAAFLRNHVEDLELALTLPTRRTLSARQRLQIEATVVRVRRQMSGTLPLLQLRRDVRRDPSPQIDVGELLLLCRSGDQPATPHSRRAEIRLRTSQGNFRLTASPRSVLTLICLVASMVSQRVPNAQCLSVSLARTEKSRCLSVSAGNGDGLKLPLTLPPLVEPTDETVRSSARRLGLSIDEQPQATHLSWTPHELVSTTIPEGI